MINRMRLLHCTYMCVIVLSNQFHNLASMHLEVNANK